jgi:hypothetical protein
MGEEFLTADRARALRGMLFVVLGLAGLLLVLGLVMIVSGDGQGGVLVLVIAAIDGLLAGLSLRAVRGRAPTARRTLVLTGIVIMVLSVPIVGILVGLLTVIAGIGLLVIVFAPERQATR